MVIMTEDPGFPLQQVGISSCKLIPAKPRSPRHPFANQKEIRVRDRLMVKPGLPPGLRIPLESPRESIQRFEWGTYGQISKRKPHMIGMMKLPWQIVAFKLFNKRVIHHDNTFHQNSAMRLRHDSRLDCPHNCRCKTATHRSSKPAAKRRKNAAHGASRGWKL